MIKGIPVSPGIISGNCVVLKKEKIAINYKKISKCQVRDEINVFSYNKKKSVDQIKSIKNFLKKKKVDKEKIEIFEGHIMLIEDEEFERDVISCIQDEYYRSSTAVAKVIDRQISILRNVKDEYLKNRIIDFKDIRERIVKNIMKIPIIDLSTISKKIILIAEDLSPSDIVQSKTEKIIGLIMDKGNLNSHVSIIAKSLDIPTIVGTKHATKLIETNDHIILDSINNRIYRNPSQEKIEEVNKIKINHAIWKKELKKLKHFPAITLDNHKFSLQSNIRDNTEINLIEKSGSEGIGLYRTEFLFMNRSNPPTEEEQFQTYKEVAEIMNPRPVIIRTIDIGGDKFVPYINIPKEENPFLGLRAIRIIKNKEDIMLTQLRAILRATHFGNLKIMFPMVISLEEILHLKSQLSFIKNQLSRKNYIFREDIEIGIMIETPSAAIISRELAKEVDFFSIGTNDLTQYTLAVDRGNQSISYLYDPISPSVLRLIKKVIENAHQEGKEVSMCGELASDEFATIILVGMELDKFSMNSVSIPKIKKQIRRLRFQEAKEITEKILRLPSSKEIRNEIERFHKENDIHF
ncbi:phosphoenolpyruvate--protein phosphotransferase [Candidatus Riesia pediculischaeffi]|uniref:Phosphoenolpyruvate-protein phosphotransferase n=1 Tax=Candidatus Riesia pediculischaeffi PTSU TaxID=1401651 RepID=A0A0C1V8U0_9ENTR|nr:phosphoenolpyruvate--protein phosphotransferase [Candidatus Riesia pediculischaeffi]KIE64253.1 Phosphoenolpyruvate-protein phosphotransferase of PTS system [Candidatus Riesia pediculischaeffi PTSU]